MYFIRENGFEDWDVVAILKEGSFDMPRLGIIGTQRKKIRIKMRQNDRTLSV
jgi:hypothetical protein